jgi:hypothetical protein
MNLCVTAFAVPTHTPNLNANPAVGVLTVGGVVEVNGAPAVSGQTLFSGCNIRTSTASESTLDLGNVARLKLGAETSLRLESSQLGLSASLDSGGVRALVPGGVRVDIITADASIAADASQLAVFSVLVDACSTNLSVHTGRVEIRAGNNVRSVSSGESFSTAGGAPLPSGSQQNLSNSKKIGLFLGIGAAVAILVVAITGGDQKQQPSSFGGCVVVPSPSSNPPPNFGC